MGINCTSLFADKVIYAYENTFYQQQNKLSDKKALVLSFNFTFSYMYIEDVLSINNRPFHDYLHTIYIVPIELETKATNITSTADSNLDLLLSLTDVSISTKLYDRPDHLDFRIVIFSLICINVPEHPSYGVYLSQHMIHTRACVYHAWES